MYISKSKILNIITVYSILFSFAFVLPSSSFANPPYDDHPPKGGHDNDGKGCNGQNKTGNPIEYSTGQISDGIDLNPVGFYSSTGQSISFVNAQRNQENALSILNSVVGRNVFLASKSSVPNLTVVNIAWPFPAALVDRRVILISATIGGVGDAYWWRPAGNTSIDISDYDGYRTPKYQWEVKRGSGLNSGESNYWIVTARRESDYRVVTAYFDSNRNWKYTVDPTGMLDSSGQSGAAGMIPPSRAQNVYSVGGTHSDGSPSSIITSESRNGTEVITKVANTLVTSGENSGKYQTVTESRQVGTGSEQLLYQYGYEYYVSTDTNGGTGDLKSVKTYTYNGSTWDLVGTIYMRYYRASAANGYEHGLKYLLKHASYARMVRDSLTPETATDAQLADYADNYFEYDSQQRVSKEVAHGCGSCGSSGTAGDFFEYYLRPGYSSANDGENSWKYRTTVTNKDESGNIVYRDVVYGNFRGNTMLKIREEPGTSPLRKWCAFVKYDSNARRVMIAHPSSITLPSNTVDETKPDLMNEVNGDYACIENSIGLVETFEFDNGTGQLLKHKLKHGETTTPVTVEDYTYTTVTVDGVAYPYKATSTVYPDGSTGVTTNYSYTYQTASPQLASMTITLPAVLTGQNGANTTDSIEYQFDESGRLTWEKDTRGVITAHFYDTITGNESKRIDDVDSNNTSISGCPWTTVSGFGLHAVHDMSYDSLGRLTEELAPQVSAVTDAANGTSENVRSASWFVYKSAANSSENWSAKGYKIVSSGSNVLINPVSIAKSEEGNILESIESKRSSGSGKLSASDTFNQSDWKRWTKFAYTTGGSKTSISSYHLIPSTGAGTSGTNYNETSLGYDSLDRVIRTVSNDGTITRRVYDVKDRIVSTWIGTNDSGATRTNPAGTGGSNNMVKVVENEYDGGAAGKDGNLTEITQYVSSSVTRITEYDYDWRNRRETTDGALDFFSKSYFDNLNRTIKTERYDTSSSGTLLSRSETSFDDRGRVYAQKSYAVNSSGTAGNSLVASNWYDASGNLIKSIKGGAGKLHSKMTYDGLGRMTKSYIGYDASESAYSAAQDVTGDTILEQSELTYDITSNLIQSQGWKRNHDATGTGALSGSTARMSYGTSWYDPVGRTVATASYGTYGGASFTRSANVPTRSDTVLVSSMYYDDGGDLYRQIDPKAIESRVETDAAGRTTKTIESYDDGDPSTGTSDKDRVTDYTYTASGQVKTLTARMSSTSYQTTEYVYGISSSDGSDLASNSKLSSVKYPDPSTGAASTSYKESFVYNRAGQIKKYTDRNGTIHEYDYDALGRTTDDKITNSTLPTGVDGTVKRLTYTYNPRGQMDTASSYDAASSGTLLNQIKLEFNDYRQLIKEYQAHSSAVNTSTSPKVQYAYANTSNSNNARLTSMTYPNGRILRYEYSTGTDDTINRLSFMAEDSAGSVGNHVEEYTYLGLGTVVKRAHPENGLTLSRIKLSGESTGDGGDQYTGFDRFGRIVDQRWIDGTNADQDRHRYSYDRGSNRTRKQGDVTGVGLQDEDYAYDNLNRLTTVTPHGSSTAYQSWSLDALGNSNSVTTSGTSESRTHDKQNRLTQKGSHTLSFDTNGNTTTDQHGYTMIYDAWNRLVEIKNGSTSLNRHTYDALGRRNKESNIYQTTHQYFSRAWQVIEERDGSDVPSALNTWSPEYVDAMVCRDYDAGGGSASIADRYYTTHDANYNITGITYVSDAGSITERYAYDAYGNRSIIGGGDTLYYFYFGHQGGKYDRFVPNLMLFRNRVYDTETMRWVQQDPLGYVDGSNLYADEAESPTNRLDSTGLSSGRDQTLEEMERARKRYELLMWERYVKMIQRLEALYKTGCMGCIESHDAHATITSVSDDCNCISKARQREAELNAFLDALNASTSPWPLCSDVSAEVVEKNTDIGELWKPTETEVPDLDGDCKFKLKITGSFTLRINPNAYKDETAKKLMDIARESGIPKFIDVAKQAESQ